MKSYLTILLMMSVTALCGQSATLTGEVRDAVDGTNLIGAYLVLTREGEPTKYQTSTDYDGKFVLEKVPAGNYDVKVSYLGYADLNLPITVATPALHLGILQLSQGVELSQVVVVEKVIPVQQRGDTTQLNAAAYKTLPDASAEELIQKMPTIAITDGRLQAQGEQVRRVIVDGKPFFGDDALATLRNLPAEIIESIEIFDQQSEEAEAAGISDGDEAKVINIVTKKDMRNGVFGKAEAGYGTDDRFDTGTSLNSFNGARRISLVGMANNVNRQNFSSDELDAATGGTSSGSRSNGRSFQVRPRGGIVGTTALGLNFTDEWGDHLKATASYFFSEGRSVVNRRNNRLYFDERGADERYRESANISARDTEHRFDGRFNLDLNNRNSLLWRPRLNWRGSAGSEYSFGTTLIEGMEVDSNRNDFNSSLRDIRLSNSLIWRHRFSRPGRRLVVNLSHSTAPEQGENELRFEEVSAIGNRRSLDQRATMDEGEQGGSVSLQYGQRVNEKTNLLVTGKTSLRRQSSEQETLERSPAGLYDEPIEELSGLFSNNYFSQELGGGFDYRAKGLKLTARAALQYATLMNDQEVPELPPTEKAFWSVLPTIVLQYRERKSSNLRLTYKSKTRQPGASQLQSAVSNANPRFQRAGNPDLRQENRHDIYLRYNASKASANTVFYALLGGGLIQNDISNAVYVADTEVGRAFDLPAGSRISLPVNLNRSWNLRALTTFGFPVAAIGSNLNLDLSVATSVRPGLINDALNSTRNSNFGVGITFSSNVSDRIDFSLSSRGRGNWVQNELQPAANNRYFQQTSRFNLNWIVGPAIIFRTDVSHLLYRGLDAELNQDYVLWNMSIGKKFLKDRRGEISLSVFDLLQQNVSLRRRVTQSFTEDILTDVLTRYLKLGLRYDIRKFGKAS